MILRRFEEALACYDKLLTIKPDHAVAWAKRGLALTYLGRIDDALASFDKSISINGNLPDSLLDRGNFLVGYTSKLAAGASDLERALQLDNSNEETHSQLLVTYTQLCDWKSVDRKWNVLSSKLPSLKGNVSPFALFALPTTPEMQLECAKLMRVNGVTGLQPQFNRDIKKSDKLRVAYVSADFRVHPIALNIVDLLERHDRSRFEIIGVSVGPDDKSEIRARTIKAVDQFLDVRTKTDVEIVHLIRDLGVHVAVDLGAHTFGHRPNILANRPAPIQVNFLTAWTSGSDYLDYIIADRHALPFDQQPFYSEQIVHLQHCCLPRDATQEIAERLPSRTEAGLPEDAVVFCCFNSAYKINRRIFDIWMRLLKAVENGVVWLSSIHKDALENLRREASDRGVDPARLIVAPRMPQMADHLARYRLADLFLDTLPYNAHSTASDALWAGLPILTCRGGTFAGRIATSQLEAIGLGKLATDSLEDYEALALQLARDRGRLQELRQRLMLNRSTHSLFDTAGLCRQMEASYLTMWDIYSRGEAPRGFTVEQTAE